MNRVVGMNCVSLVCNENSPFSLHYSFFFTQIDASDPLRRFSFLLLVDDEDTYEVQDCQPPISSTEVLELVDNLNDSNDFVPFVRGMSKS